MEDPLSRPQDIHSYSSVQVTSQLQDLWISMFDPRAAKSCVEEDTETLAFSMLLKVAFINYKRSRKKQVEQEKENITLKSNLEKLKNENDKLLEQFNNYKLSPCEECAILEQTAARLKEKLKSVEGRMKSIAQLLGFSQEASQNNVPTTNDALSAAVSQILFSEGNPNPRKRERNSEDAEENQVSVQTKKEKNEVHSKHNALTKDVEGTADPGMLDLEEALPAFCSPGNKNKKTEELIPQAKEIMKIPEEADSIRQSNAARRPVAVADENDDDIIQSTPDNRSFKASTYKEGHLEKSPKFTSTFSPVTYCLTASETKSKMASSEMKASNLRKMASLYEEGDHVEDGGKSPLQSPSLLMTTTDNVVNSLPYRQCDTPPKVLKRLERIKQKDSLTNNLEDSDSESRKKKKLLSLRSSGIGLSHVEILPPSKDTAKQTRLKQTRLTADCFVKHQDVSKTKEFCGGLRNEQLDMDVVEDEDLKMALLYSIRDQNKNKNKAGTSPEKGMANKRSPKNNQKKASASELKSPTHVLRSNSQLMNCSNSTNSRVPAKEDTTKKVQTLGTIDAEATYCPDAICCPTPSEENFGTQKLLDEIGMRSPPKKAVLPPRRKQNQANLLQDYDKLPTSETTSPPYKYKGEVVRKKEERRKLPGWTCKECQKYYELAGQELSASQLQEKMNRCSKHRDRHEPRLETPRGFWDPDFPSTAECSLDKTLPGELRMKCKSLISKMKD